NFPQKIGRHDERRTDIKIERKRVAQSYLVRLRFFTVFFLTFFFAGAGFTGLLLICSSSFIQASLVWASSAIRVFCSSMVWVSAFLKFTQAGMVSPSAFGRTTVTTSA